MAPFPFISRKTSIENTSNYSSATREENLNRKLLDLQDIFNEQKSKIDELDDPLSCFEAYYQQLTQLIDNSDNNNEASSHLITTAIVPVLDSATQTFAHDPRYRNDARYLKLWLAYSKYCREAEDIFVFLSQQGIAQELATFYEEYAVLLVEKNNLKQA